MIAVDTSALMAILLGGAGANACAEVLQSEGELVISAGTVAEALIVSSRHDLGEEMARLIQGLGFEIVSVTAPAARRIAAVYEAWGKGSGTAGLNLGDCFAYELAKDRQCPLLFVGAEFAQTDIKSAI